MALAEKLEVVSMSVEPTLTFSASTGSPSALLVSTKAKCSHCCSEALRLTFTLKKADAKSVPGYEPLGAETVATAIPPGSTKFIGTSPTPASSGCALSPEVSANFRGKRKETPELESL